MDNFIINVLVCIGFATAVMVLYKREESAMKKGLKTINPIQWIIRRRGWEIKLGDRYHAATSDEVLAYVKNFPGKMYTVNGRCVFEPDILRSTRHACVKKQHRL